MKLKYLILTLGITVCFSVFSQKINPITKAVLDSYEDLLKQNPKDFGTLYQKAAQLYTISDYDGALKSLIKAIEFTPAKETSLKQNEFSLLADIQIEKGDFESALTAINSALTLDAENYANLYKKGNILLALGKANEAIDEYKHMQRLKSRSPEAFFGMAKANAMLGNQDEVEELLKAAIETDRYNYLTYIRIGNIYEELGRNADAATSYLSAFGIAEESSRPISYLIELGEKDFGAVCEAIDLALSKSTNQEPLYFLRANIANLTGNLNEAYNTFSKLISASGGKEYSVYATMANVCKSLNKLEEAEQYSNLALANEKSFENLIIKADIDLANGKPSSALLNAKNAYEIKKDNEALLLMARASVELNELDNAINYLNEAILNDGGNPELLMLRAYIFKDLKNEEKLGNADISRVANITAQTGKETAYKAIAKNLSGKAIDSNVIIENYLKENQSSEDLFYGAIYYAQTGNTQKAKSLIDEAIKKGYQNQYNLEKDKTPYFNLTAIREKK